VAVDGHVITSGCGKVLLLLNHRKILELFVLVNFLLFQLHHRGWSLFLSFVWAQLSSTASLQLSGQPTEGVQWSIWPGYIQSKETLSLHRVW